MKNELVKIDVAAFLLNKGVDKVFGLVAAGTTGGNGIQWVFNLARKLNGQRRDLRFWRPELLAWGHGDNPYGSLEIGQVIAQILPETPDHFTAGEVDQLLQIRPRTRKDFGDELNGHLKGGRNEYQRKNLVAFLKRRWIGAEYLRAPGTGGKAFKV